MLPPQVIEAEEYVLSSLLNEPLSYHRISTWLSDESFYKEDHKMIFRAIAKLHATSKNVDFITVAHALRESGELEMVGGNYRLTELTSISAKHQNIEEHALVVQQKFLQREMIRICSEYTTKAYTDSDDVFDLYDNISADLFKKVSIKAGKEAVKFMDVLKERLQAYEKPTVNGLSGLGSGFPSLDKFTGGWQPSDLIIIAARPGMGKTAYALNLARNAAVIHKAPVAFFSLEMSKEQLVDRLISAETEIFLGKIRNRNLAEYDYQRIHHAMDLINSDIYIDDTPALSIQAFRSKAIRLKMKFDIQLIVVDYLQMMQGNRENKNGNREQEISSISRGLKGVAKELNVPVLALSQLSRAVENRPGGNGKRPLLSDLRESGSIEQDADLVNFLFRPEYYGIEENEYGESIKGQCESIFAKNRHGEIGTIPLEFNGAFMKFSEWERGILVPVQPEIFTPPPVAVQTEIILKPNYNFDNNDEPF